MFTLFNSKKIKFLESKIIKENQIDIRGNLKAQNENKVIFDLNWSFKSSYENNLILYGTKGNLIVDFIFSKNVNQDGRINIYTKKKLEIVKVPKSNQINLAFEDMLSNTNKLFNERYKISLNVLKIIERLKKK